MPHRIFEHFLSRITLIGKSIKSTPSALTSTRQTLVLGLHIKNFARGVFGRILHFQHWPNERDHFHKRKRKVLTKWKNGQKSSSTSTSATSTLALFSLQKHTKLNCVAAGCNSWANKNCGHNMCKKCCINLQAESSKISTCKIKEHWLTKTTPRMGGDAKGEGSGQEEGDGNASWIMVAMMRCSWPIN